jgi:hypothetical protein
MAERAVEKDVAKDAGCLAVLTACVAGMFASCGRCLGNSWCVFFVFVASEAFLTVRLACLSCCVSPGSQFLLAALLPPSTPAGTSGPLETSFGLLNTAVDWLRTNCGLVRVNLSWKQVRDQSDWTDHNTAAIHDGPYLFGCCVYPGVAGFVLGMVSFS